MLRKAFSLQFLDLNELAVEQFLEFCLFLLHLPEFVVDVPEFSPEHIHLLLEFIDGLESEFQLQAALFVALGLSQGGSTISAVRSLVFSMSSTR